MRIAPRTLLCGNAFRVHADISGGLFEELRELCAAAGDKASLAIGMAGLVDGAHDAWPGARGVAAGLRNHGAGRVDRRSDLDGRAVLVGDRRQVQTGEMAEALRWSQTVIDLADGDPAKGQRSSSGRRWRVALATRGTARWALGRPGWRDDFDRAVAMARRPARCRMPASSCPHYGRGDSVRVLLADDAALRDIDEALRIAERSSEDLALGLARFTLGVALVHRDSPAERERGLAVLGQVRDMCLHGRFYYLHLASSTCTPRGSGPGAATATVPYRYCVKPSTTCSIRDSSGLALGHRRFGGDAAGARRRG